jgi:hypothetical protein
MIAVALEAAKLSAMNAQAPTAILHLHCPMVKIRRRRLQRSFEYANR